MFKHRYKYWFILGLSVYTFLNTVLCDVYHYFQIQIEWYYALLTILAVTFLVWEGNRLIERSIVPTSTPSTTRIRNLIVFFLVGNLVAVIAAITPVYVVGSMIHDYSWRQNQNPLKLNIIYAGLVNLFFHLINAIFLFFNEYKRQWREAEELRRMSSLAQVQLVKSQINPHFLFNNLNVLSGMVIKDNPDANRFIEEFSKVYRYVLKNQEKELVDLGSELEFIQPYLFLLNKRFEQGLIVEIDIPKRSEALYVIPIALQMLIENAVKHNVVSRVRPLRIDIRVNEDTLVISNNLQPRQAVESSNNIGLTNLLKRYELISERAVMINNNGQSFEVTLPLLHLN